MSLRNRTGLRYAVAPTDIWGSASAQVAAYEMKRRAAQLRYNQRKAQETVDMLARLPDTEVDRGRSS